MDLKVGDIVKFKSAEILANSNPELGWNTNMNYLCNQTRTITQDILEQIKRNKETSWNHCIWIETNGDAQWYISLDMIELVS
jgi:hypothetical protein